MFNFNYVFSSPINQRLVTIRVSTSCFYLHHHVLLTKNLSVEWHIILSMNKILTPVLVEICFLIPNFHSINSFQIVRTSFTSGNFLVTQKSTNHYIFCILRILSPSIKKHSTREVFLDSVRKFI